MPLEPIQLPTDTRLIRYGERLHKFKFVYESATDRLPCSPSAMQAELDSVIRCYLAARKGELQHVRTRHLAVTCEWQFWRATELLRFERHRRPLVANNYVCVLKVRRLRSGNDAERADGNQEQSPVEKQLPTGEVGEMRETAAYGADCKNRSKTQDYTNMLSARKECPHTTIPGTLRRCSISLVRIDQLHRDRSTELDKPQDRVAEERPICTQEAPFSTRDQPGKKRCSEQRNRVTSENRNLEKGRDHERLVDEGMSDETYFPRPTSSQLDDGSMDSDGVGKKPLPLPNCIQLGDKGLVDSGWTEGHLQDATRIRLHDERMVDRNSAENELPLRSTSTRLDEVPVNDSWADMESIASSDSARKREKLERDRLRRYACAAPEPRKRSWSLIGSTIGLFSTPIKRIFAAATKRS